MPLDLSSFCFICKVILEAVFDAKIDIFYNNSYNILLKEKNPKVKDNFNLLM